MPTYRRRSAIAHRGAARRRTAWATSDSSLSMAAAGNYTTADLLAQWRTAGGNQQSVTVVRTHLKLVPNGTRAVGDILYFGLLAGQMTDVGLNVVGAPNPATDQYEEWAMLDRLQVDYTTGLNPYDGGQREYDIRAQRKLMGLHQTWNIVLTAPAAATFPTTWQVFARTLVKLP
jgi:hypothetical protein